MKIGFFYEWGHKPEIGTGHKYRCRIISNEMQSRGHKVYMMEDGVLLSDTDILVIDHVNSQKELIKQASAAEIKSVLIDGAEKDVARVDESISAIFNENARHTGLKYMCFPTAGKIGCYNPDIKSSVVFVGVGGYDCNNLAEFAVDILADLGLNAIVARGINHSFSRSNMEFYDGDCYFDAMSECLFGIVAGGLTLFQSLFYGLPVVSIPQYEHQKKNIFMVSECCLPASKSTLGREVKRLLKSSYLRTKLSVFGSNMIDGNGCHRVCNIIEAVSGR